MAQAHRDKAGAQLALGDVSGAITSYQAALDREASHPHLLTQAYLELPLLIARERLKEQYEHAHRV